MTNTKPLWQSKTILSALVALFVAAVSALWGVDLAEAELIEALDNIVVGLAALGAIWGRVTATKRIQ